MRPMLVLVMATALSRTSIVAIWAQVRRRKSTDLPASYGEQAVAGAEQ